MFEIYAKYNKFDFIHNFKIQYCTDQIDEISVKVKNLYHCEKSLQSACCGFKKKVHMKSSPYIRKRRSKYPT